MTPRPRARQEGEAYETTQPREYHRATGGQAPQIFAVFCGACVHYIDNIYIYLIMFCRKKTNPSLHTGAKNKHKRCTPLQSHVIAPHLMPRLWRHRRQKPLGRIWDDLVWRGVPPRLLPVLIHKSPCCCEPPPRPRCVLRRQARRARTLSASKLRSEMPCAASAARTRHPVTKPATQTTTRQHALITGTTPMTPAPHVAGKLMAGKASTMQPASQPATRHAVQHEAP